MEIGYERVDHLIAIAAASSRKSSICKNYPITTENLLIKYSDYVKSQVHLNISSDLYDRPLSVYVNALRYLRGDKKYYAFALKVLRYFYLDISKFLINNKCDVRLRVLIDVDLGLPERKYSFVDVQEEIVEMLSSQSSGLLRESKFASIFDDCESAPELKEKLNSYTIAAILKYEGKQKNLANVVVIGGTE